MSVQLQKATQKNY